MTSPDIRRMLQTCLVQRGVEVWLLAGRRPQVRFPDDLREMMIGEPLTSEDITELILDGAIRARAYWQAHGFYCFDWACDWCDARFRVFLVRHAESVMATMTPLPPGTPEIEHADDAGEPTTR